MSTVNVKKCNNCGAIHDAQDIFCGTCGNQFNPSGENYTTPTLAGLQQGPLTPNLQDTNLTAPTQTQPLPQSRGGKAYLIILPILALVLIGAGILLGTRLGTSNNPSSSSNLSGNVPASSDPTANVATSNPTSMPSPTQIATPSPTQTSIAAPGTILYQENGSDNWQSWALSSDWKVVDNNSLIRNDGSAASNQAGPSAIPPFSLPQGVQNFAIETTITVPQAQGNTHFSITACGSTTSSGWQGYEGLIAYGGPPQAQIFANHDELAYSNFDPGTQPHTYRLEVRGNVITLLIDHAPVLQATDNKFLTCGNQVGLVSSWAVIQVNSFKVIAF